jgi:heme A synthase
MLFAAHSGVRYLVLLVGLIAFGYAVYGAATRKPYDRAMLGLARAFAGLTHLQILLGVAVIFTGRFYPALIGHIVCMVLAAVVATIVPAVMRKRQPAERSYTPHAVAVLVALTLMVMGIMAIGRGPFSSTMGG